MADRDNTIDKIHSCPFCDDDIAEAAFPYCQACEVNVLRCPKCHLNVPRDAEKCPHCGADIKAAC
ncbi:MAG: double zinc ribbon domain-containing protein [Dehalococcoidales bacterium]